jgi:hypothetical protein
MTNQPQLNTFLFQRVRATAHKYSPAIKYNVQKSAPYPKTTGKQVKLQSSFSTEETKEKELEII